MQDLTKSSTVETHVVLFREAGPSVLMARTEVPTNHVLIVVGRWEKRELTVAAPFNRAHPDDPSWLGRARGAAIEVWDSHDKRKGSYARQRETGAKPLTSWES